MAATRLPAHWLRLQRGAEHLHRCGPRYVAHFLAMLTLSVPERMAMLDKLDRWRRDIDPPVPVPPATTTPASNGG
jgi:hypothetical protein